MQVHQSRSVCFMTDCTSLSMGIAYNMYLHSYHFYAYLPISDTTCYFSACHYANLWGYLCLLLKISHMKRYYLISGIQQLLFFHDQTDTIGVLNGCSHMRMQPTPKCLHNKYHLHFGHALYTSLMCILFLKQGRCCCGSMGTRGR